MGNKDNYISDSSSDDEKSLPPKRQRTEKDPKKDFLKHPIYNIKQTGSVVSGAPHLSTKQREAVLKAKKFAIEVSVSIARMKQKVDKMQIIPSQTTTGQRQQAIALMCRVYVGSISFELKEDTIRQAFLPFGPIKSINMSYDPATQKHKGFAFVEYDIPEAAQLALDQMNGAMLGGRNIKVGRPSNMPQAQAVIDEIMEEAKGYNGIFIASIHPDLSDEDVKSVFEAFGAIVSCKLPPSTSQSGHRGYGFIEYTTNQSALEAIASMNLFDLGGQLLRIGRSITPFNNLVGASKETGIPIAAAKTAAAAKAAAAATAKIIQAIDCTQTKTNSLSIVQSANSPPITSPTFQDVTFNDELETHKKEELHKKFIDENESSLQQQESMSIKGQNARHLVMQKLMRNQESKVVVLRNMVGPDDVDESLQEEIQDECSKFGKVEKVIIYKEKQTDGDDDTYGDVIVKIFVEFSTQVEADKASSSLNGRFFGGRLVKAESYDQSLFDYSDFSN